MLVERHPSFRFLWFGVFAVAVAAVAGVQLARNRSEASVVASAEVPSFLPSPAGAALVQGIQSSESLPYVLTWSSADPVTAVLDGYRTQCQQAGWTVDAPVSSDGVAGFEAVKGAGAQQAVAYTSGGRTVLTVTVTAVP